MKRSTTKQITAANPEYSFSYRLTIQKKDGTYKNYSEQTMLSYYQANDKNYNIHFASKEAAEAAIEKYKNEMLEDGDTIPEGGEIRFLYVTATGCDDTDRPVHRRSKSVSRWPW